MNTKNQMKELQSMIDTADEYLSSFHDSMVMTAYSSGISQDVLKHIERIASANVNPDIMKNLTDEDLIAILKSAGEDDYNKFVTYYENRPDEEKTLEEVLRNALINIFSEMQKYVELKKDKDAMTLEAKKAQDEYMQYLNSDEYKASKQTRLDELKQSIENCESVSEKFHLKNEINFFERLESFSYIFDRLNTDGEKEANRITTQFFNKSKSEYIIDRYTKKLKPLGLSKSIHRVLFNIEEKFLPEEYHMFNNLFLFGMMREIAYTDVYSNEGKANAKNIFRRLHNLVYHESETSEINDTKSLIMKYLDFFKSEKEAYVNNNITYPKHPTRIERDKDQEQERRMMLIAAIENIGLEAKSDQDTHVLEEQLREAEENLKQQQLEVINNIIDANPNETIIDDTELQPDTIEIEDDSDEEPVVLHLNDNLSLKTDCNVISDDTVPSSINMNDANGYSQQSIEIMNNISFTTEPIASNSISLNNPKASMTAYGPNDIR